MMGDGEAEVLGDGEDAVMGGGEPAARWVIGDVEAQASDG